MKGVAGRAKLFEGVMNAKVILLVAILLAIAALPVR